MNDHEGNVDDRDLALALRRLAMRSSCPTRTRRAGRRSWPPSTRRNGGARPSERPAYWFMAGLATAAAADRGGPAPGPDWTSRSPSRLTRPRTGY